MPHAGRNHPDCVQSYSGALKKANVINCVPRVPRHQIEREQTQGVHLKISEYYNIEISEPDLINEDHFSKRDLSLKFKAKTPHHNDLNHLPKRKYEPPLNVGSKSKKKRQIRSKTEEREDGLTFMNRREHFMKDQQEKKRNHARLANKVT